MSPPAYQRAEASLCPSNTSQVAPLVRGADGAARHPYLPRERPGSWFRGAKRVNMSGKSLPKIFVSIAHMPCRSSAKGIKEKGSGKWFGRSPRGEQETLA